MRIIDAFSAALSRMLLKESEPRDAGLRAIIIASGDDVCALPRVRLSAGTVLRSRPGTCAHDVGAFKSHDVDADVVVVDVSDTHEWRGTFREFSDTWTVT